MSEKRSVLKTQLPETPTAEMCSNLCQVNQSKLVVMCETLMLLDKAI